MKYFYKLLIIFVITLLIQGCSGKLYNVEKNVKLNTIKVTKLSEKTGRTTIFLPDNKNLNSVYENNNGLYTIQKKRRGYVLYGITSEKEIRKDKKFLISDYHLKKIKLSRQKYNRYHGLVDSKNLYIVVTKNNDDDILFEYTNDMQVKGAKKILLEREKAEKAKLLAEKKKEERRIKAEKEKQLAKQRAEKRKILAKQRAEKRKILAQQKRAKKLQKIKTMKRNIGRKVTWYESHKVDTDDCVKLYFFKKCMWVTYQYKFVGKLQAVNNSSYIINVVDGELSARSAVSMNYLKYKDKGLAWGQSIIGSSRKISLDTNINLL